MISPVTSHSEVQEESHSIVLFLKLASVMLLLQSSFEKYSKTFQHSVLHFISF